MLINLNRTVKKFPRRVEEEKRIVEEIYTNVQRLAREMTGRLPMQKHVGGLFHCPKMVTLICPL